MTHLIISEKLSKTFASSIASLPQFYLGSIAPDAVHNRANYVSDFKKASHLCVGGEKWGQITNHEEWEKSITGFYVKHRGTANHDFVMGYCSHLLADSYNNKNVWIPFREKHPEETEKGYGSLSHLESNMVDIELALTYEGREDFWAKLARSSSVDFPGIIYAGEIDKQKDNILNIWFKDKQRQDLSANKMITLESMAEFIENATACITKTLQNIL